MSTPWTDADEARLREVSAQLDAFHEVHRTPATGSCWCCCLDGCDDAAELQREYWLLTSRRQEASPWP